MTSVVVTGLSELIARLEDMASGLVDDTDSSAYLAAAQTLAMRARENAPFGQYKPSARRQPGRLRKSIIARAFSASATARLGPGAFAQVNLKGRYGTTAPYGHIVESGRKGRNWFFGRRYFARAVEELGAQELERAAAKLDQKLKRRYGLN